MATRRVGRAVSWGVALTVGAVVLRELTRPRAEPARLIDWDDVERIALNRCGEPDGTRVDQAATVIYEAIAAELAPLLGEALGRGSADAGASLYPPLTAVGRRDWVRFNVRIFRQMFQPLERLQEWIPQPSLLILGHPGRTQ